MSIHQLSVFVENKSGRLLSITKILKEHSVDIRAFSIADTTDFGILRLIVDKPDEAREALKQAGFMVRLTEVIAVSIADHPGALADVLEILSNNGISVEYAYAFITRRDQGAYVILRVEDNVKAARILQENSIELLPASEVYAI